jgi:nitroimidazol reductase NimA-like FMN-containing flavoprotein (pyridoxamine 5'-phosphate oxidase superfamily)
VVALLATASARVATPAVLHMAGVVSRVLSRRAQIQMTEDEAAAFLEEHRIVVVATNGRDGWPHLMPLWYFVRDGELWGWTYAKSQKVRNLERDDRATLQVEEGHAYNELRGVMIKARCERHRDLETVAGVGEALAIKYGDLDSVDPEAREVFRKQAAKRVALQFHVVETATWDHRKLGGVY